MTDAAGTILLANETILDWLGYDSLDVVGAKRFVDLLTGGGRIYHETHYRPTLQLHGEAHEIALEVVAKEGTRMPVLVNSVVDKSPGHEGLVRTIVFKATDRLAYEAEILRQRRRAEASEADARLTAQTLQQMLVPPAPPSIDGLDVGAAYRPAGDGAVIGGDFYNVFELESGDWVVAIGDVCGKGVGAAVVARHAQNTLRAVVVHSPQLDQVMHQVNDALLEDDSDRFVTMLLTRFRRTDGAWRVSTCCGGHPPPLLFRGHELPEPICKPGRLVGALDDVDFHHLEFDLMPDDLMLLYTDGVTEGRARDANGVKGDFYGEERMIAFVAANREKGADELAQALVDDVLAFQNGNAADDVAVVFVRVR